MIAIIAQLVGIFLGALGVYAGAVHLVKVYTGCSTDEAIAKIQNLINGKIVVPLAKDPEFYDEICQAIRNIIGEKRYGELTKLNSALCVAGHFPVIGTEFNSGVPYVAITVQPKDDTEKQIIETVLVGLTKKHLVERGFGTEVLADWRVRMDIKSQCLQIRYPENAEHRKLILDTIVREGFEVLKSNSPLTDNTEADDLSDD